jgi:hypothetical protein
MTDSEASESAFELDRPQLVIGRGHGVDIPVTDAVVSRQHAMLVAAPGGAYMIVALPDTDGVWVNGKRRESHMLSDGDVFTIGDTELQYCESDPRAAATRHMDRQGERPASRRRSPSDQPSSRTWIGLLVFFVLLGAGGFTLWWFVLRSAEELPPIPASVQPQGDVLFELDTTTQVFDLPMDGGGGATLSGNLTDSDGRREIVYRDTKGGQPEIVFPSDWNLPAAGVVTDNGGVVVCGNRLTGSPSELTKGDMPDPRGGVELRCRRRGQADWGGTVVLDHDPGANWLIQIRKRNGTVYVTYSHDEEGILIGAPTGNDGQYIAPLEGGKFGPRELVKNFDPPITHYPAP